MIVAEQKPLAEIKAMLHGHRRVLLLGCGTCVTVCLAGGRREVAVLAALLRMSEPLQTVQDTIERQCDAEFFEPLRQPAAGCDAILSLACGIGVQMAARQFPDKPVYPALNTKFMGTNEAGGRWQENCLACGDCKLGLFGGICPITRCSKSLANGPCGGSHNGKCEVDPQQIDCGWQLIYERLKALNKLASLAEIAPALDWSKSHSGGPRQLIRKDIAQT